ncbi:MAG TPA: hypothetical protein VK673_21125 [Chthoniobacterales bacterium]|nr:hypothetical protein [Chthoniobacterales bacterium]
MQYQILVFKVFRQQRLPITRQAGEPSTQSSTAVNLKSTITDKLRKGREDQFVIIRSASERLQCSD